MKKITSALLMVGIVALNFGFFSPKTAMAASLTSMSDTVSNLTASTAANHTIKFTTPTGVASGQTIILTFSGSTNTGSVAFGDMDLQDDGVDVVLAATSSGTTWGAAKTSATVITFTNGSAAVAAGSIITIKIGTNATGGVNQITNGSVGTTTLTVSGSFNDTGVISMAIIANGVVAVSASVLGSITFSVDANSINFGTLSALSARYANTTSGSATPATSITLSAGTNAPTGYSVSVQGDTLTSGVNTITPLAVSTASATGGEQFGINLVKGGTGALGTISSPYGTASQYAYTATAAVPATIATASGATDINTYAVTYLANISALTEAGSYATSHTYVATGNF